jgi:hypothetical protein
MTPPLRDFIAHEAPHNTSQHGAPPAYYDDDLAALVAARDATVVDAYGYRVRG